jgi:hypothetical protein
MATWWEITFTGTPSETDLEHVAELVRDGFTSGQLTEHDAAPAPGSWRARYGDLIPDSALPEYPGDYPVTARCAGCDESIWVYEHDQTWTHRAS